MAEFDVKFQSDSLEEQVDFGETHRISDGGYERGLADGEAIGFEKGHTAGQVEGYGNGYSTGFTDGKNSVENYLPYSTMAKFPDLNLLGKADVTINIPYLSSAGEMFRNNDSILGKPLNRTVEHITINAEQGQPANMTMMFYMAEPWDPDNPLKHITLNMDTSKAAYADNMFNGLTNLTTVDGTPLDFSSVQNATVNVAGSCAKLAHIRFAPGTIKCGVSFATNRQLTNESIQSIIDGLADLTGQAAKTVRFHTDVVLKLTDEQWQQINSKNWAVG